MALTAEQRYAQQQAAYQNPYARSGYGYGRGSNKFEMNLIQTPNINRYAMPVDEMVKTAEFRQKRQNISKLAYDNMSIQIANDKVLDVHAKHKTAATDKWNKDLEEVIASGDYGSYVDKVRNSTRDYMTDPFMLAAKEARVKSDNIIKEIDADPNLDGATKRGVTQYFKDNTTDLSEISPGVIGDPNLVKPQVGKYYDPIEIGNKLMNYVKFDKDLALFDMDTDALQGASPEMKAALSAVFGSVSQLTPEKLRQGLYKTFKADKNITGSYQERNKYGVDGFNDMNGDLWDAASGLAGLYSYRQEDAENLPNYSSGGGGGSTTVKTDPLIGTTRYSVSSVSTALNGGPKMGGVREFESGILATSRPLLENVMPDLVNKTDDEIKDKVDVYYGNAQTSYMIGLRDAVENDTDDVNIGGRVVSQQIAKAELQQLIRDQEKLNNIDSRIKLEIGAALPGYTDKNGNIDYRKVRNNSDNRVVELYEHTKSEYINAAKDLATLKVPYTKAMLNAKKSMVVDDRNALISEFEGKVANTATDDRMYPHYEARLASLKKSKLDDPDGSKGADLMWDQTIIESSYYDAFNDPYETSVKKYINDNNFTTLMHTDMLDVYQVEMFGEVFAKEATMGDEEFVTGISDSYSEKWHNFISDRVTSVEGITPMTANNLRNKMQYIYASTDVTDKLDEINEPEYSLASNGMVTMDGVAGNRLSIENYYGPTTKEFKKLDAELTKGYRELVGTVPGKYTPDETLAGNSEFQDEFEDQIASGNLTTKDLSGSSKFHIDASNAGTVMIPYGESYWTGVAQVYKKVRGDTGEWDKKQILGNITFGVGKGGLITNDVIEEQQNQPKAVLATSILRNMVQSNLAKDYNYTPSFNKSKLSDDGIEKIMINGETQKIYVTSTGTGVVKVKEYAMNDQAFLTKFAPYLKENVTFEKAVVQ